MPKLPWLTLVSDVDPPTAFTSQPSPALARLAGRGSVRLAWDRGQPGIPLRPWQRGLLHALRIDASACASAPVAVRASVGLADSDAFWLHAEPVHFVAGLDRLSFLDLRTTAPLTSAERVALFDTMRGEFGTGDLALCAFGDAWFIRAASALRASTSSPDAAAANELQSVMPDGPDAPVIRRFMTEMQMVLHDHPVNQQRARSGLPAVNAIWPWGGGMLAPMACSAELPVAFSCDLFIQGLYRLHEQTVRPLAQSAADLLSMASGQQRIIVAPMSADPAELESRWISPFTAALADGQLSRLDLVLGEWLVEVPGSALRRFWRRPLAPPQWGRAP